jgi:hypothetical protein
MKKFLIGAVATAAIVTPCVAHADTNAIVGLNIGGGEVDTLDWDTVGIDGAFSHDFNNGTVMQFEAAADRVDIEDVDFSSNYAAVHYGVRSDSHAFGGFVSMEELFFFSGIGVGVEGQLFLGNIMLDGSVAYNDFDTIDVSLTTASLNGTYFFNPNLSATAGVGFTDDELYGDDTTSWNIGGEWRFSGSPASIELGYRSSEVFDEDVDAWMIGFNFDFGADSVQQRSRSGPSFDGARDNHNLLNIVPGGII